MKYFRIENHCLRLDCFVQPGAGKNEIIGLHNNALKIRLSAPPVEGKANKQLTRFLAKQLRVAPSSISITKGQNSRHKTLCIQGIDKLPTALEFP
ncbi:MAG: YggU family protein [Pseudomonadales bacterium]|nr:YggU family protein [Pseudomonadales bacterium]